MAKRNVIPEEFITTIKDKNGHKKEFVLLGGLLELGHQQGLKKIKTTPIQLPTEENHFLCIVQAEIETEKGEFTGIGDASPKNVSSWLSPHIVRMAETRAVARALRFATNVGMAAFEELGELDVSHEELPPHPPVPPPVKPPIPLPQGPQPRNVRPEVPTNGNGANNHLTAAQGRAIWSIGQSLGWTEEEIRNFVKQIFNTQIEMLDKQQASTVIQELHQTAAGGG